MGQCSRLNFMVFLVQRYISPLSVPNTVTEFLKLWSKTIAINFLLSLHLDLNGRITFSQKKSIQSLNINKPRPPSVRIAKKKKKKKKKKNQSKEYLLAQENMLILWVDQYEGIKYVLTFKQSNCKLMGRVANNLEALF